MLIDLHTHTLRKSTDSCLSPEALSAKARLKGLDGVCLTEHNTTWSQKDLIGLPERYGLRIFRGIEVSTDIGHVLVFGIDKYTSEMMDVYRLARIVEQEDGAMILAHPWREGHGQLNGWSDMVELFDAVEVISGSDSKIATAYWAHVVSAMGLFGTGGSDAHSVGAIGSCATKFETATPIRDEVDLVKAIKAGNYCPVWLDGPFV